MKMPFVKFVEIILARLYELENEYGSRFYSLNDIAGELLEPAPKQWVFDAGKILESRDWAKCVFTIGGNCRAMLTGEGRMYVEQEKGSGIIGEYHSNPQAFIITGGGNQVNVAGGGQQVSQTSGLTAKEPNFELLDEIVEKIRQTTELQKDQQTEFIENIEMVRKLLEKQEPNRSAIAALLQPLSNVSSIASLVVTLIDRVNAFWMVAH